MNVYKVLQYLKLTFMSHLYKKAILILVFTTSALVSPATIAASATDPFYTALDKTQQKKFTEAANELDALAVRYQRKGDYTNAYRSRATAVVIRYEHDYNTAIETGIGSSSRQDWVIVGSCLYGVSLVSKEEDRCAFGLGYYKPPTNFKNMDGIISLNGFLEVTPNKKLSVRSLLDVLVIPKIKPKEKMLVVGCNIYGGSKKGQRAIALARFDKENYKVVNIRQAWYADLQSKQFKPVNPKFVACQPNDLVS
jgi:hypothetical protein